MLMPWWMGRCSGDLCVSFSPCSGRLRYLPIYCLSEIITWGFRVSRRRSDCLDNGIFNDSSCLSRSSIALAIFTQLALTMMNGMAGCAHPYLNL